MELTPKQRQAVERRGQDVCVVAGPGSGKTRVLIERFAWLVENCRIDPSRVLAITFTEKAAAEIKSRLIDRFASRPDLRDPIERAWVSTIHGFCARLLRENAIAAGISPDFEVLEQAAAETIAREAAEDALEELYREDPAAMRRLLESVDLSTSDDASQPDLAASLLEIYEALRSSGLAELPEPPLLVDRLPEAKDRAREILGDRAATGDDLPMARQWASKFLELPERVSLEHFRAFDVLKQVNLNRMKRGTTAYAAIKELRVLASALYAQWTGEWYADLRGLLRTALARIDAKFREKKRALAALDFADLEEESIRLLESDAGVHGAVRSRFNEILMDELQDTNRLQWKLIDLVRQRLFAVGDINQSIFGFRHAEPAVFREFRDALVAKGSEIDDLRENHRSFQEILDAVGTVLDGAPGIEPRPLVAARKTGGRVERIVARGDDGVQVEAALVASRIREMVDRGDCKFKDIAILVRAMGAAEAFEQALERFDIPFLVSGGRTFLEAREIRDLMMLLAALVNPLDDVATVGVLRSPLVGLGDEEIFRLGREGWLAAFDERFGKLRRQAGFMPPDLMLAMALDESGYCAALSERAQANVEKFLAYLRRGHKHRPLAEVLDDMEALRTTRSEAEAPPPDAGDIVRIMSIHAAKGLEFKVVFAAALHRRPDSRKPVIVFSASRGVGVKWRNPATGKSQSDAAYTAITDELKLKEAAEENRLLYVAMTRAEDLLILSHIDGKQPSPWQKLVQRIPETLAAEKAPDPPGPRAVGDAAANGLGWADPPVVSGQYDSSAAVTAIANFQACPRKYYWGTIAAPEYEAGDGAISTGLSVHRILAGAVSGDPDSEEAIRLAARFTDSDLGKRAALAQRVEREFDFQFEIQDVILRGQIDLWFEDSGELIVVDYKTDRDESSWTSYALQLQLYALALERYLGRRPDRGILYYLRPDKAIDVSLDSLESAEAAVVAFRVAQDQGNFPMRPGELCRKCAYFEKLCPAKLAVPQLPPMNGF
jgi:ATP-dependent helicase/nuclease subunit A